MGVGEILVDHFIILGIYKYHLKRLEPPSPDPVKAWH